jgi:hypothetical protein
VEGSHKGWNSLQRVHTSGIVTFTGLCHDFVLRRNVRVAFSRAAKSDFISSTHGSHHIHLVDGIAKLFNHLRLKEKAASMCCLPELKEVPSKEHFGLVKSGFATTFGGLLEIKVEDSPIQLDMTGPKFLEVLSRDGDAAELALQTARSDMLEELNIDPQLLSMPQAPLSKVQPLQLHPHTSTATPTAAEVANSSEATPSLSSALIMTVDPATQPRPTQNLKRKADETIVISESEDENSDQAVRGAACKPPRKIMCQRLATTNDNAMAATASPSNQVSSMIASNSSSLR